MEAFCLKIKSVYHQDTSKFKLSVGKIFALRRSLVNFWIETSMALNTLIIQNETGASSIDNKSSLKSSIVLLLNI